VIYDYGSSPAVYLASQAFAPYLDRGAAELTLSTALCVDGLPDNAGRLAHVLRHFEPRLVFVRAELVPLLVGGPTAIRAEWRSARLVVTADGDAPAPGERAGWERAWPGGVGLLARCDSAALVVAECPDCRALCVPDDLYETSVAPLQRESPEGESPKNGAVRGTLTVAPRFLDLEPMATELNVGPPTNRPGCTHPGSFALA
jgi:hypothetical protein